MTGIQIVQGPIRSAQYYVISPKCRLISLGLGVLRWRLSGEQSDRPQESGGVMRAHPRTWQADGCSASRSIGHWWREVEEFLKGEHRLEKVWCSICVYVVSGIPHRRGSMRVGTE